MLTEDRINMATELSSLTKDIMAKTKLCAGDLITTSQQNPEVVKKLKRLRALIKEVLKNVEK